jgi:hypothetical protein
MDLGRLWSWEKKKLPCKVRTESGNPAVDDLRERVAELAGISLSDFLDDGSPGVSSKGRRGSAAGGIGSRKVDRRNSKIRTSAASSTVGATTKSKAVGAMSASAPAPADGGDLSPRMKLPRETQRTLMSAKCVLEIAEVKNEKAAKVKINVNKMHTPIPRALPAKLVMDVSRERVRLLLGGAAQAASAEEASAQLRVAAMRPTSPVDNNRPEILPTISAPESAEDEFAGTIGAPASPILFGKEYSGDLFGTYMGGMVYMSRMPVGEDKQPRRREAAAAAKARQQISEAQAFEENGSSLTSEFDIQTDSGMSASIVACEEDMRHEMPAQRRPDIEGKIQCLSTLLRWSCDERNSSRLVKEGAVEAVLKMSKTDCSRLQCYCAATLKRFTLVPALRSRLISRGAVPIIADLASQSMRSDVRRNCAIALASMTTSRGVEEALVEESIVLALMSLVMEQEDLAPLCAQGLYNLTCVVEHYNHVERVVKALVSLSASGNAAPVVKLTCARAFCNLSDLTLHSRLIEEGVIQAMTAIARGADVETRRICSLALCSLSSNMHERANLVTKGIVPLLFSLSGDEDVDTMRYVACTLHNLESDRGSHGRIIQEGGASALCNISMSCPTDPTISLPCAQTLRSLSRRSKYRVIIAEGGCIPAMVVLLQSTFDEATIYAALLTLCSILTTDVSRAPSVEQGALSALLEVARVHANGNPAIREASSLALFNFSCGDTVLDSMVAAGAVPIIIKVGLTEGQGKGIAVARRCAATLCNLTRCISCVPVMVDQGIIPAIIELLKMGDAAVVKYCCAALCVLAQDPQNCLLIIQEGAVPHMIAGSQNGGTATQQSCCAVLSALSSQKECREQISAGGALAALVQLAATDDAATRFRCIVAFANLSCEPSIQEEMVENAVAQVLANLSHSYCEDNQLYVAQALCNLACHHGSEARLIDQGTLTVLMMIAMVRSVRTETKQICARAMLNLLTDETLPNLLKEGLVAASTSLSKLDDADCQRACATMFACLAERDLGRKALTTRPSALVALFELLDGTEQVTRSIAGSATIRLLQCDDSVNAALAHGGGAALQAVVRLGQPDLEVAAANTLWRLSCESTGRMELTEGEVLPTTIYLACSSNYRARVFCVITICNLAWHPDSRPRLSPSVLCQALASIVENIYSERNASDDEQMSILPFCARALYYLTLGFPSAANPAESSANFVAAGALLALSHVLEMCKGQDAILAASFAAGALRTLSEHAASEVASAGGGSTIAKVLETVVEHAEGAEAILSDCAVVLLKLAQEGPETQRQLASNHVVDLLSKLTKRKHDAAAAAAVLCLLTSDAEAREVVALEGGGELAVTLATAHAESGVLNNIVCALFYMSHATGPAFAALRNDAVIRLLGDSSKSSDEVQKKLSAEALSGLTSSSEGGIEEGAVSALISRSIDTRGNSDGSSEMAAGAFVEPLLEAVDVSRHVPGDALSKQSAKAAADELPPCAYLKTPSSGGGGSLPPPPSPPKFAGAMDGSTHEESGEGDVDGSAIGIGYLESMAPPDSVTESAPSETDRAEVGTMGLVKLDLDQSIVEEDDETQLQKATEAIERERSERHRQKRLSTGSLGSSAMKFNVLPPSESQQQQQQQQQQQPAAAHMKKSQTFGSSGMVSSLLAEEFASSQKGLPRANSQAATSSKNKGENTPLPMAVAAT